MMYIYDQKGEVQFKIEDLVFSTEFSFGRITGEGMNIYHNAFFTIRNVITGLNRSFRSPEARLLGELAHGPRNFVDAFDDVHKR